MGEKFFEVRNCYENGENGEPLLHRIDAIDCSWKMSRRSFLVTTALGITALGLLSDELRSETEPDSCSAGNISSREKDFRNYLHAHTVSIRHMIFSPDSGYLVTLGMDNDSSCYVIKVWSAPAFKLLYRLKGSAFSISPDSSLLFFIGGDGNVNIADIATGSIKSSHKAHGNETVKIAVSPDGKRFITCAAGIYLWDSNTGKLVKELKGHDGSIYNAWFSNDGNYIVCASLKKGITWDSVTLKTICTFPLDLYDDMLMSHGSEIVTSFRGRFRVYDYKTGKQRDVNLKFKASGWNKVRSEFSPDGRLLLTHEVSDIMNLSVRNFNTGKVVFETNYKASSFSPGVGQVSIIPPGNKFASARTENGIVIQSLDNPIQQQKIGVRADGFVFSENMNYLAVSCRNDITIVRYPEGCITGKLFDPEALVGRDARVFEKNDQSGAAEVRILPGDSPELQGYVCTCNTVKGSGRASSGGGSNCSCVPVCTCVPVK